jgi:hypothetical protein
MMVKYWSKPPLTPPTPSTPRASSTAPPQRPNDKESNSGQMLVKCWSKSWSKWSNNGHDGRIIVESSTGAFLAKRFLDQPPPQTQLVKLVKLAKLVKAGQMLSAGPPARLRRFDRRTNRDAGQPRQLRFLYPSPLSPLPPSFPPFPSLPLSMKHALSFSPSFLPSFPFSLPLVAPSPLASLSLSLSFPPSLPLLSRHSPLSSLSSIPAKNYSARAGPCRADPLNFIRCNIRPGPGQSLAGPGRAGHVIL